MKDFFREAGPVGYTSILRNGTGIVQFKDEAGMLNAVKKFDNYLFRGKNIYVEVSRRGGSKRSPRSRSPSRERVRRRSQSPRRSP